MSGSQSQDVTTEPAAPVAALPERAFEELTVDYGPELDYLDPGLAFTTQSWSLLWHVYLPLLTYRHATGAGGAMVVPALAEELPAISDDALVYQFRLRAGLEYSDGRPVRASDVRYAVERLRRLESPGAAWFAEVEEIRADDEQRTVEFRLRAPQAQFLDVLATPFAAPVPQGTDAVEQAKRPIPATGPYRIERFSPGEEAVLVRNERFRPKPEIAPGNADRIRVDLGRAPLDDADYVPLASPSPSTAYVFMNTQLSPFDRLELRRAVSYAIDREALAASLPDGGEPSQNLLPPGVPGHLPLSVYEHDLQRARALVRQADAEGAEVTVWASAVPASRRPGRALVRTLRELGLRAGYREVPAEEFFRVVAGRQATAQIGVSSWSSPLPHPIVWFDALVHGDRIGEAPNTNLSYADVPELNDGIETLRRQPLLTDDVVQAWAELDRLAIEAALVAPFASRRVEDRFAERVDPACVQEHPVFRIDLAWLCLSDGPATPAIP